MTRLVSGRIQKIPSANVSAERYQFIEISEVEPDLGLPSALGQVFTSDLNGTRYWINLDTANINETSNLYFTNTRAILALDGADISVGNLISQGRIEGNTLSVSNIFADLITANTIISNTWVNLYSSNVIEFQNLFYTNSRVLSHLAESDVSVQDLTVVGNLIVQGNTTTLNTETLVVEDKNIVIANGAPNPAAADGAGITIEGANATITFVAATDSIEINKNTSILGNIAIGTGLGGSITGANLIVANILVATERIDGTATAALIANVANTVLSLSNFTTTDLAEGNNLYYTNVRVDAYINDFIDTDDIDEANNLYYTNARVLSHLSQSDVETRNLTVYGNLNVVGNLTTINASTLEITDPLIKIAANNETSDAVDFGWLGHYSPDSGATRQHAGVFRKHNTDNFYIFSEYVDEELDNGNLVTNINLEDPTFKLANVYGNVFHGRISTLENHTTDALVEGTNLYYTNTRVVSAVTPLLTTANVFELSSNLYYTNARVLAFVETLSISDLRDVSNIYEANVGGLRGVQTGQALVWDGNINQFVPVFVNSEIANVADLAVRVLSLEQFTTANIAEASSNLYFTNTRVLDALIDSNVIVNNLFVQGDLTVQGNTVTLNVSELVIEDKNIVLANGAVNAIAADGAGITVQGANAEILYVSSLDSWVFNKDIRTNLVGNVTGFVSSISNHNTDDLAEANNLYYTNARVLANVSEMSVNVLSDVDITGILPGQIISWDGNKFVPGSADVALFSERSNTAALANVAILANIANLVLSLENFTTNDLEEGSANLYFTSRRAIDSFSAGKGIIITEAGTISSIDDSDLYNIAIDNSVYDIVTTDGKSVISIDSNPTDASYLVHSLQLTNITDNEVYISGNIQFASGQNVDLLNRLKMPVGSSLEILEKSLILLPGDVLNLTTFDGNVSVAGTYESVFNDESFINPSLTIAAADADELVYNSNLSYAIIETIKVVNLDNTNIPVKITVADANNNPKGYLIYNLDIPQNSIVDVLQKPKRLENGDKLFASYTGSANSNAVSIFVSGRLGAVSGVEIVPAAIDGTPGNTVIGFATTEAEGTTLYYTFTEV